MTQQLKRLPTGIANLDRLLGGGLLCGGAYIVQGPPGAGKTILANQIAAHRVREGGNVVYMTLLSEGHDRMMAHLSSMAFFDPDMAKEKLDYISGYSVLEQEGLEALAALVRKEAARHNAELLVLDGLFVIEETAQSQHAFRRIVNELQVSANLAQHTLLLLTNARRDPGSPEYTMVDGWIELSDERVQGRSIRDLEVHKFRGGETIGGRHRFRISGKGIDVFPRLETVAGKHPVPVLQTELATSGIPDLDGMLRGGLCAGSATLLFGPSGTGKTMAALQFAGASTAEEPGLFLGFYESPVRLARKAQGVGINLPALEAAGAVHLHWRSPTEILVDEVADWLLGELRRTGARRLVVDSAAGFLQNLLWDNRAGRFFNAFCNELRVLGVTTLITFPKTGEGLSAAPSGQAAVELATLVDNLLAMRMVERDGVLHKELSILKVPDRDFDPRLMTFTIGPGGIALAG